MPFDIEDPDVRGRLAHAMTTSRRKLGPFRKNQARVMQQYVGFRHGEQNWNLRTPINKLEQYFTTYTRELAPNNPAAFVRVRSRELIGIRTKFELGITQQFKKMNSRDTMNELVFDSLNTIGVAKVGIDTSVTKLSIDGVNRSLGEPFFLSVLLDDWLHDMEAPRWSDTEYQADRRRQPRMELLESGLYPEDVVLDMPTVERRAGLDDQYSVDDNSVLEYVDVWQVWIPRAGIIVKFIGDARGPTAKMLGEPIVWRGPSRGPYHRLMYQPIRGRTMPLAPVTSLLELHELNNAFFRKTSDQAMHSKKVFGARRGQYSDVKKLIESIDRGVITTDGDPNMIKDFDFPGADPSLVAMQQIIEQKFSEQAGNLDLLAGLGAQSETATQDTLLFKQGSKRLESMKATVLEFTSGIMRDVAFWMWDDPFLSMEVTRADAGSPSDVALILDQRDKIASFIDFNIETNPYSMRIITPQDELQIISTLVNQFILPFRQEMAQQGLSVDIRALIKRFGELTNMRTLDEFIMFLGQPGQPANNSVGTMPIQSQPPPPPDGRGANQDFQKMSSMINMIAGRSQAA